MKLRGYLFIKRYGLVLGFLTFLNCLAETTGPQSYCEDEFNECEDVAAEKYQKAIEEAEEKLLDCKCSATCCLEEYRKAMEKAGKEYDETLHHCTIFYFVCTSPGGGNRDGLPPPPQ